MFKVLETDKEMEKLSLEGQKVMDMIEASPKPVVSAIMGSCLGGGLEVGALWVRVRRIFEWVFIYGDLWGFKKLERKISIYILHVCVYVLIQYNKNNKKSNQLSSPSATYHHHIACPSNTLPHSSGNQEDTAGHT